ncbi:MAG: phosphoribosylamine--glycine ligase [Hyphomicrobiaceae bacterium]|nr:phosphoribosylamine--glycine ligase [Hyphomicrobiaceae bacterium]
MNVLLIGGGGREHALAVALARSARCDQLFCAPGNAGIAEVARCVPLDPTDHPAIVSFCRAQTIGLVVIGPEQPLVDGLVDDLGAAGFKAFGPTKAAARLEGSKGFTKDLCRDAGIPTGSYGRFATAREARTYLETHTLPVVIKADGLAAGKGVTIATNAAEALRAIHACFSGAFGAAGAEVVIEEFLDGEEASFFALVDGETAVPLATAQDHKRVGDGDTGPNTGGMGAYSPAPVMTPEMVERTMAEIIRPTVAEMARRGTPFRGVLFAGLMITAAGPQLIEYNVRFGDPECQALLLRLKSDLLEALLAAVDGRLNRLALEWRDEAALTVVMAARGYPGTPEKGSEIRGLGAAAAVPGVSVFHAGTSLDSDGVLRANGGRVLNIGALGTTVADAQARAYQAISLIEWPEGFCRTDIGWRAIARTRG